MVDKDNGHILSGARFLHPAEEVDENEWSREPEDYSITHKFRQRYSELSSVMSGDIIEDAFRYGELIQASQGHVAFMNDLGGVTISIIVDSDESYKGSGRWYRVKSIWPYVYDKEKALDTGQWSSRQLFEIEEYVARHKDSEEDWEEY